MGDRERDVQRGEDRPWAGAHVSPPGHEPPGAVPDSLVDDGERAAVPAPLASSRDASGSIGECAGPDASTQPGAPVSGHELRGCSASPPGVWWGVSVHTPGSVSPEEKSPPKPPILPLSPARAVGRVVLGPLLRPGTPPVPKPLWRDWRDSGA